MVLDVDALDGPKRFFLGLSVKTSEKVDRLGRSFGIKICSKGWGLATSPATHLLDACSQQPNIKL